MKNLVRHTVLQVNICDMRLSEIEGPMNKAKSKVFPKTPEIETVEKLAGLKDSARMKSVEELGGLKGRARSDSMK